MSISPSELGALGVLVVKSPGEFSPRSRFLRGAVVPWWLTFPVSAEKARGRICGEEEGAVAKRINHYDAAFEEYLRNARMPHVVVDETRRALLEEASLKSMDFIVYSKQGKNLLVDVKGRRFPTGADGNSGGTKWENWATRDDLDSLLRWEQVFGGDFRAVLVFAYHIVDPKLVRDLTEPFQFRNRVYSFYAVGADDYRERMQQRSASWETVTLPMGEFRQLRVPVKSLL